MKEIRVLITDAYDWDSGDWYDLEDELECVLGRWLNKSDYTYLVWDVEG